MADLEKLSIPELKEHIAKAESILAKKVDARLEELQAEMATLGVKSKSAKPKAKAVAADDKRAEVKPKYRSMKDSKVTWAGRGQQPKWLKEEMKETGKGIDAFLI